MLRRFLRSWTGSLGLTLFVCLFALIVLAFGAYAVIGVRTTSRQWDESSRAWAASLQQVVLQSTHHAMLLNRKEDVGQIVRTVAKTPGIGAVRVYDHRGVTAHSSNPGEVGGGIDMAAVRAGTAGVVKLLPDRAGGRVLRLIGPIDNAPECWNAPCHAHPRELPLLGALEISMSMAGPDARLAETERQIVWAGVLIALGVALTAALLIRHVVRRPVEGLIAGAKRIAAGEFGTEIPAGSRNEVGELARAFNVMSANLRKAHDELTEWSTRLEVRLQEKTAELGSTQRQVAHMDKMASLGRLAATVAHELNNPLAGILTYARLVERTLQEAEGIPQRGELTRCLGLIQKEAARSGAIVKNLLTFARRSGLSLSESPLNPVLERSALLVSHHAQMAGIRLELDLLEEGSDTVVCDPDQLEQALVALLVNAVEATPGGGTLRLAAEAKGADRVVLSVSDTGSGIPESLLPHIFEPFFTSKEAGSDGSVGLGLSVVYGIVERHGGTIEVDSTPGRGTTFRITLPRRPESPAAGELAGAARA